MEEKEGEGGTSPHSHSTQELQALLGAGALCPHTGCHCLSKRNGASGPGSVCFEPGLVPAPVSLPSPGHRGLGAAAPADDPCELPGAQCPGTPIMAWAVSMLASLTVSSASALTWAGAGVLPIRDRWRTSLWFSSPTWPDRGPDRGAFLQASLGAGWLSTLQGSWAFPLHGHPQRRRRAQASQSQAGGRAGPRQTHRGVSEPSGGLGCALQVELGEVKRLQ